MNKKVITIGFVILFALFVKSTYGYYNHYMHQLAVNDAETSMYFHCVDNLVQPIPLAVATTCDFQEKNLTVYPFNTFHSWEWNCVVRCYNNENLVGCSNLALVTLWGRFSDGSQEIITQQCVNINQPCGQTWHIVSGNIADGFPTGYAPGTYWLNVGIWNGSCGSPGSTLIAAGNSPNYVVN